MRTPRLVSEPGQRASRSRWWQGAARSRDVSVTTLVISVPPAETSLPSRVALRFATLAAAATLGVLIGLGSLQRLSPDRGVLEASGLTALGTRFGEVWLPPVNRWAVTTLAGSLLVVLWRQARCSSEAAGQPTPRFVGIGALSWSLLCGFLATLISHVLGQMTLRASFPFDLLLWSESSFVQDMIKLRHGLSPYLEASRNNSYVYHPGAPFLTWAISSICGRYGDLTFCRDLQLGFLLLACALAWHVTVCLTRTETQSSRGPARATPVVSLALILFLVAAATNPNTSPFVDLLHNDSLAILTALLGLAALVSRDRMSPTGWLILAAPLPALAVAMKQTGAIVGVGLVLGVWIQERRVRPAIRLGLFSAACLGVLLGGLALWSNGWWYYWAVRVLAKHPKLWWLGRDVNLSVVAPLLPLVLACAGWAIFALPRASAGRRRVVLSAFVYTALLMGSAAVTSLKAGTAAANHWGPAGLALAALAAAACRHCVQSMHARRLAAWANLLMVFGLIAATNLLHSIPPFIPRFVPNAAAYGYAIRLNQLLRETDPHATLLDHGSMYYLRADVVPEDRANSISESTPGGVREVDDFIHRLLAQQYERIVIHEGYGDAWYGPDVMRAIHDAYELQGKVPGITAITPWCMMTDLLVFRRKPPVAVAQRPPRVLRVEPAPNSWTTRSVHQVEVAFSHPMDPDTINDQTILLRRQQSAGADSREIEFSAADPPRITYDPQHRTAYLSFAKPLPPGFYKVVVTPGVRDQSGRSSVDPEHQSRFHICPPIM